MKPRTFNCEVPSNVSVHWYSFPILPSFTPPKAGSTSFVPLDIKTSSLAFSNQMVEKTGIMTVPSEMFNHRGKYIRVGFGRANFPEMLEILGQYLKTY